MKTPRTARSVPSLVKGLELSKWHNGDLSSLEGLDTLLTPLAVSEGRTIGAIITSLKS